MKRMWLFQKKYYYYDSEYDDLWWSYDMPRHHMLYIMDSDVSWVSRKRAKELKKSLGLSNIPYKKDTKYI